jgi:hypothetical protein
VAQIKRCEIFFAFDNIFATDSVRRAPLKKEAINDMGKSRKGTVDSLKTWASAYLLDYRRRF